MRIRDQIANILYKPSGYLDLMRRLTGLWLIGIMRLELLHAFNLNEGPYHVPAWRIGQTFLIFPEPPAWVSAIVWPLDFIACVMLVAGVRHRILPIYLFLVWFYYQTLEWNIFHSSFVILLSMYLLAFSIERKPRSLSRLVIQVALSTCYLFSALHKLHPEFLNGHTLHEILGRGFMLRPELLPFVSQLDLPDWVTHLFSWGVIYLEGFIGLGLWFKSTRMYAVLGGIFLHLAFTLAIPGIDLFAPVVWTGYLAFFEPPVVGAMPRIARAAPGAAPTRHPNLSFPKPLIDIIVASLACTVCLIMPARLFFLGRQQYLTMSLYDRVPWGFSMFLFHEEVISTKVSYQTTDQTWHPVPLTGRMPNTRTDSDLVALAYYIARRHPDAFLIRIETHLETNSHAQTVKICVYMPQDNKLSIKQVYLEGNALGL